MTLTIVEAQYIEWAKNGLITVRQESYGHSQHSESKAFQAPNQGCLDNYCPWTG